MTTSTDKSSDKLAYIIAKPYQGKIKSNTQYHKYPEERRAYHIKRRLKQFIPRMKYGQ